MYSYHYREKQEKKSAKKDLANEAKEKAKRNAIIGEKKQTAEKERGEATQKGMAQARELFNRETQGFTPAERQARQYEAERGIERGMQAAHRKLLGDQAQRGIVGKGGVKYAQQRDLERMGMEAKGQAHRDLEKLNADRALKKLAAEFAAGQGEAALSQLDKQAALDELNLENELKKQRSYQNQFNRSFSRI